MRQKMQLDKSKFPEETHQLIDLLESSEWPEAVPDFLICSETEEDKIERAMGVVEYMKFDFAGKKILDYGCGEGHLAMEVANTASTASCEKSVGFDIVQSGIHQWEKEDRFLLTTSFDKVKENGPYDFVVLYDVLDHCVQPVDVMSNIIKVCHKDTKIFVRCHSWMSRHGGHIYRQLNKAWAHLVFTKDELSLMGIDLPFVYKVYTPVRTQSLWFQVFNLHVEKQDIVKTIVEDFFKKPEISARLPLARFNNKFPEHQMAQSFNDYFLNTQFAIQ